MSTPRIARRRLCSLAPVLASLAGRLAVLLAVLLAVPLPALAQAGGVLNLYSARHYQTDEALYANFTKATGIKINRLDGKEEELVERIRNEGTASPADVLITVDAARLEIADSLGLFQPIRSKLLDERIPAGLRTPNWVAFSTRARVIVFNKAALKREQLQSYANLAGPALKGQVCMRSGSHPYNLSLGAAIIAHEGEAKAEAWAKGLVANFARAPQGGDTDQIKSVAAGECGVTISNTYYLARMLRSSKAEDQQAMNAVGIVCPTRPAGAPTSMCRAPACSSMPPMLRRPCASWNTWPATRPRPTLPTATTSGRWSRARPRPTRCWPRWARSRPMPCPSASWRRMP